MEIYSFMKHLNEFKQFSFIQTTDSAIEASLIYQTQPAHAPSEMDIIKTNHKLCLKSVVGLSRKKFMHFNAMTSSILQDTLIVYSIMLIYLHLQRQHSICLEYFNCNFNRGQPIVITDWRFTKWPSPH